MNAVAGYSYFEKNGENFNAENYDFGVEGLKYWDLGAGFISGQMVRLPWDQVRISQSACLHCMLVPTTLTMTNIWFLPQSVMRDHQKFAAENRWGNFWALSGGWRVSAEEFMKEFDWVSDLKVRFGYGVTGNNDFDASYMVILLSRELYWMLS